MGEWKRSGVMEALEGGCGEGGEGLLGTGDSARSSEKQGGGREEEGP